MEARATEETAMKIKEQSSQSLAWPYPWANALGIPLFVSEEFPEGKLQFWQDGELVREIDI